MPQASPDRLKEAVESQHGGTATFVQAVPVHEERNGQTVWDGAVSVFDLKGSSSGAFRAYAWLYDRRDDKRHFFSVLHSPKVNSPRSAVRAAIVAGQSAEN